VNPLQFSQIEGTSIVVPGLPLDAKTMEVETNKYLICCIKELHHCRNSSVESCAFNFLCYL